MLLFDLTVCQPIGDSKYHGGGVYGYIVFKHLALQEAGQFSIYIDRRRFIPHDILDIIQGQGITAYDSSQILLTDIFKKGYCSCLYTPLFSQKHLSLIPLKIPIMLTIHGLRALEMNRDDYEYIYANNLKDRIKAGIKQTPLFSIIENRYLRNYQKILEYQNIKVAVVSEHTKASIMTFYPDVPQSSISVYYSPSTIDVNSNIPISSDKDTSAYYLILSANRWLKNSFRAILALDRAFDHNQCASKKVKVVGLNKSSKIISKIRHKERFDFLPYCEREQLEHLLANAYILLYTSLNEGFGYPPLEAMRYGVPVISSPFASLTEILKDSVLYANPYSITEIQNRILQMENTSLWNDYHERALKRYVEVETRQNEDLDRLVKDIIQFSICQK